jgi:hypothetical protein
MKYKYLHFIYLFISKNSYESGVGSTKRERKKRVKREIGMHGERRGREGGR